MTKNVLVTGIGGNVGCGILRNIINSGYQVKIVGTNTEAVSGGNHLCDKVYQVPFGYDKEYIRIIEDICRVEKIDLIIPSTDCEAYYLALERKLLPPVAVSDVNVELTFFNKYKTWLAFKQFSIPFAATILGPCFQNDFPQFVVKPIEGSGSHEIYINPSNIGTLSDNYIVQELLEGIEITTAFYVTRTKELLGFITFKRILVTGATNKCEVTFDYEQNIKKIIMKMISNFNIKGSCNIQSIVDGEGNVTPFEVNCRISGTNSIRSNFGFEDVKYTLEEYLYNVIPKQPRIKKGAATRVLMDVIYPGIILDQVENKYTKHYIF